MNLKFLYLAIKEKMTAGYEIKWFFRKDNTAISGRVDGSSATEMVNCGSIPGRVQPKTIKIGIHSFLA